MPWVEIFRSRRRADCEQRSFVLFAVGIMAEIQEHEDGFVLLVAEDMAATAVTHLRDAEAESARVEPKLPPLRLHEHAWVGCVGYGLVLCIAAFCDGQDVLGRDWFSSGALSGPATRGGDWWRTITALMLHGDLAHLFANLAFGLFFGFFAGQTVGAGLAWFGTLIAAALGNLIDVALVPNALSVGASTAVFATLGLLSAYSWRRQASRRAKWAYRFAPLVAGIALLAMTGSGGENTDVLAHLAGFVAGVGIGLTFAFSSLPDRSGWRLQCLAGLAALSLPAVAWFFALI